MYHRPVLLEESLNGLDIQSSGTYVDFTFGGGGHSAGILERLGNGKLIAFDQDPKAGENVTKDKRLLFIRGNFRYVKNFLRFHGITSINGALADLGVSSHHFDAAERGFSFRHNSPIDMRMNPESKLSAADVLNDYAEDRLKELFRDYGEISNAGRLASCICRERAGLCIDTTGRFVDAIEECVPGRNRSKYLARVFQALRIEVNAELECLAQMLGDVTGFMQGGARFVIITYHSLEDRMVKNYFRSGNVDGVPEKDFYGNVKSPFRPVNRKVIQPGEEEIRENPRARSAKLRIAERTAE